MVKQEHLTQTETTATLPPLEIQIPTDQQIEAISNPGHLPDFLNQGILAGLTRIVKARQKQFEGLEHQALLVGDPGYIDDPHNHRALLAMIKPDTKAGNEQLTISSNLGPGLFLHLSLDAEHQLDSGRAVHATHTGIKEGWYSKTGSGPSLGQARVVGRVIETALPTLLAYPEDIEAAA